MGRKAVDGWRQLAGPVRARGLLAPFPGVPMIDMELARADPARAVVGLSTAGYYPRQPNRLTHGAAVS